jgi:hypothetical protein
MTIFNASLKVAVLLIALGYLVVWANSEKGAAGRYAFGRWGADDAPPVVLDTHTGKVYSVSGKSDLSITFDFISGTVVSRGVQHQ